MQVDVWPAAPICDRLSDPPPYERASQEASTHYLVYQSWIDASGFGGPP
jgi:hypothetical protein